MCNLNPLTPCKVKNQRKQVREGGAAKKALLYKSKIRVQTEVNNFDTIGQLLDDR